MDQLGRKRPPVRLVRSLVVLGVGALVLLLADGVFAQPAPDYIKITPPPGMRWKTLDQSGITGDITFVDKDGNTWLRKSAAATFARSFVLVQLVGDSGGTDQWMDLVENLPRFLGLRPDPDWGNYRDRKSTRLNSSHDQISYAVFCLKK